MVIATIKLEGTAKQFNNNSRGCKPWLIVTSFTQP